MAGSGRNAAGYSLPELLVVIALMGIFVLFGVPSLREWYLAYKVRGSANLLVTDIRALRYNAVSQRAPQSMTIFRLNHGSTPNQYGYTNIRGQAVTVRVEDPVVIESPDAADTQTITFAINGATAGGSTESVILSADITESRGDRYTITVSPSGTVSTAFTYYTP